MLVISESQFTKETPKYLQLAKKQRVIIRSGDTKLELSKQKCKITEEDLARALTGDELLERVIPRIEAMYKQ